MLHFDLQKVHLRLIVYKDTHGIAWCMHHCADLLSSEKPRLADTVAHKPGDYQSSSASVKRSSSGGAYSADTSKRLRKFVAWMLEPIWRLAVDPCAQTKSTELNPSRVESSVFVLLLYLYNTLHQTDLSFTCCITSMPSLRLFVKMTRLIIHLHLLVTFCIVLLYHNAQNTALFLGWED